MARRSDQSDWVEALAAPPSARRRRPALTELVLAVDDAAKRHPAAVLATVFCGGLAAGAWLGVNRRREEALDLQDPQLQDPPLHVPRVRQPVEEAPPGDLSAAPPPIGGPRR